MESEAVSKKAVVFQWRAGIKNAERAQTFDGTDLAAQEEFSGLEDGFLFDSVGLSVFSHNLQDDKQLKYQHVLQDGDPSDTFRLAVLEGRVSFTTETDGEDPLYWDTQGARIRQGALRQNKNAPTAFRDLKNIFLEQLRVALAGGADVIMAGEFGCPSSGSNDENEAFMAEIRALIGAVERPVFLVAGSRHTPSPPKHESPYNANVAMIFGGDPKHSEFQKSVATQPIEHFKRSPSISLAERIFSPDSENLPVYVTPFCNFGLLICSDAFDTQILFSFLRQNSLRHRRAQVILIPAFNKSELFYDSCRYLSYLASATVIVVNSHTVRFPEPALKVFTAGFSMNEFDTCIEKRKDAFKDMSQDQIAKIIDSVHQLGFKTATTETGVERGVGFYNIDRVMLETFSERLADFGGPLLRRSLDLSENGA